MRREGMQLHLDPGAVRATLRRLTEVVRDEEPWDVEDETSGLVLCRVGCAEGTERDGERPPRQTWAHPTAGVTDVVERSS